MFPVGPASTVDAGSSAGDFQSWSEMAGYRSHTHPLLRVDLAEQDMVRTEEHSQKSILSKQKMLTLPELERVSPDKSANTFNSETF